MVHRVSLLPALCLAACGWLGSACGGTMEAEGRTGADGGGGEGWGGGGGTPSGDAKTDKRVDAPKDGPLPDVPGFKDQFAEFKDDPCPDAPPPKPEMDCDPYAPPPGGCPAGEACYPYVIYPKQKCEQEKYGATCMPAGTSKQGDPCGGLNQCAPGHVCVISGAGTQCTKLCKLGKPGDCPEGLVCEPLDVQGFGVCF